MLFVHNEIYRQRCYLKMHYYFLLNIKHGASQLYLGPKYNCEAHGEGQRRGEGPL